MRKFRAWDGEKFYTPILYDGNVFSNGRDFEDFISTNDPVMQYTIIKDNDGKQICESDIVITLHDDNIIEKIGLIQLDEDGWLWGEHRYISTALTYTSGGCKIIGNIYENPELIEELDL